MTNYINRIMRAVQKVPVKNRIIAEYVTLRIYNLLTEDSLVKTYLRSEVDIPEFMKNNVVKFERRKDEV